MNSTNETSTPLQTSTNSNDSSQTAESCHTTKDSCSTASLATDSSKEVQNLLASEESDFLTAPLMGICPTPLHLLSDTERKNQVLLLRQLRQSAQTYKAELERKEEEVVRVKKVKGPAKKVTSSDIDALLE